MNRSSDCVLIPVLWWEEASCRCSEWGRVPRRVAADSGAQGLAVDAPLAVDHVVIVAASYACTVGALRRLSSLDGEIAMDTGQLHDTQGGCVVMRDVCDETRVIEGS